MAEPRAAIRELCGDSARVDDAAVIGTVRDASTNRPIDSAFVVAKWIDLTLWRGSFTKSVKTQTARTRRDGSYVICGVPAKATILAWTEFDGATSGVVPLDLKSGAAHLDLTLDRNALPSTGSVELEPTGDGVSLFPVATGTARYHLLIRDEAGRSIPNARVRVFGHRTQRTNGSGTATIDSIAGGTQTIEVLAIGYQPLRRTVDLPLTHAPTDTFTLTSLGSTLDTVRVVASRNPSGFERRRAEGKGDFITASDIERENPDRTTRLLRTRDGLRLTYDRQGYAYIEVTNQARRCAPILFVDGFLAPPVPMAPGEATMDWLIHPDEIGGVEIYTHAGTIPPEYSKWANACAIVAFWSREALGLPRWSGPRP